MTKGILAAKAHGLGKDAGTSPQSGSLLLEAVIVLGMIATFTPLLYKHVADRRADIENINRANTLLYLQQKTEKYLKDPANIKALVDELGHNQHKEIYPSELGIDTTNFDGRYIIGIRREDEENKPVLKAMIIDTVNTGSDLRAARVAELIGVSAGIYTAVDPDAAWGINGLWSESLSRYFNTTNIPTGAVAVTTEYNKKKYRVNISDILVDSDLDLGEFDLTAEQINAINLAAQKGTIDQLIATTKVSSPKVVAETKLCLGSEDDENCIESWKGLGEDGQDSSDLILIQMCNSGLTEPCTLAFARDLNTSCSKVDAVYDRFRVAYPNPKVYTLTYGSGGTYGGEIRVRCGTSFMVDNISSSTLANPVEQVGGPALAVTQPGWYLITLMGEAGVHSSGVAYDAAGGVLFANKYYSEGDILTLKGIKGWVYSGAWWGGAGIALWDTADTTGAPTLVAGGGAAGVMAGGGYEGGTTSASSSWYGYGWDGSRGGNTTYCDGTNNCDVATGGMAFYSSYTPYGGTGHCGGGYNCTQIAGGNSKNKIEGYAVETYGNGTWEANGNWVTDGLTGGKGYASIAYCGSSQSDCPTPCIANKDCPSDIPFCDNKVCYATCVANSQCPYSTPFCVNGSCETRSCSSNSDCTSDIPYCVLGHCYAPCISDSQCPSGAPYCNSGVCGVNKVCSSNSQCFDALPFCVNNICALYPPSGTQFSPPFTTLAAGRYKIQMAGESGRFCDKGCSIETQGGKLTATVYYNKGVQLTVTYPKGQTYSTNYLHYSTSSGSGVVLLANGSPVLAVGGGGARSCITSNAICFGGGGYIGGKADAWWFSTNHAFGQSGYSWDGTVGSSTGGGIGGGGSISETSSWNYRAYCYGGQGLCSSGYSCSSGSAISSGIAITYCGPKSNSSCP